MFGDSLTISPAYGRDFTSKAKVLASWEAGQDFSVGSGGGPYVSIRDSDALMKQGHKRVNIRYARLARAVSVELRPQRGNRS